MSQEDASAHLKTRGMVDQLLPPIPAKRYFTIGEVSELCAVKPHVLRYWEQEFTQLRPMKRRGNRRYYQHHEVLLIRKIRELLYDEGFTIQGARMRLAGRQTISNLQAEAAATARVQLHEQQNKDQAADEARRLNFAQELTTGGLELQASAASAPPSKANANPGSNLHADLAADKVLTEVFDKAQASEEEKPLTTLTANAALSDLQHVTDTQASLSASEPLSPMVVEQLRFELNEALRLLSIA